MEDSDEEYWEREMEEINESLGRGVPDFQTFQELIDYNLSFLRGEREQTFYHFGPVEEETLPLLDKLREINSYGFVSASGQPSLCEKSFTDDRLKEVETQQKSFIEGWIEPTLQSRALIFYLKTLLDVYFVAVTSDDSYSNLPVDSYSNLPLESYSNLPVESYNVTRERNRNGLYDEWSEWNLYTNIYADTRFISYKNSVIDTAIHVQIADASEEYCSGFSVEDVLVDFYTNRDNIQEEGIAFIRELDAAFRKGQLVLYSRSKNDVQILPPGAYEKAEELGEDYEFVHDGLI